jgi:hypothetical protein
MCTPKLSNFSNPPRMWSASVPDRMVLRMAEGMSCPHCGRPLRNYPRPLGPPDSFALICDGCHHDVLCYEPQQ